MAAVAPTYKILLPTHAMCIVPSVLRCLRVIERPPSTNITVPDWKLDASEARKREACAVSRGSILICSPHRLAGEADGIAKKSGEGSASSPNWNY
jgi:hypothetical protein